MIIKNLNIALISTVIAIIKIYQLVFSPILKQNCRYLPTCSEYSIKSFEEYGFFKGLYYSFKRILKCHPFGDHGYDPVPKKINKEN